jgi:cell division protein FtsQ
MNRFTAMAQGFISVFDSRMLRAAALALSCAAVATTIVHGASKSGAFENEASAWSTLPGRLASLVGLSADHIQISGLAQHDAEEILAALNLKPGKALIGFDANAARKTLESIPWVKTASVEREYPNMLKINVSERNAIALWQMNQVINLIDDQGVSMGQPRYLLANHLPLVTGEGANTAAAELINDLSAIPALQQHVTGAARVGKRRWTLYLDNGVKLALPEQGVPGALQLVVGLDREQAILSKGITMLDMRVEGRLTVQVAEAEPADGDQPAKKAVKQ